jgi:adenosine deaminase
MQSVYALKAATADLFEQLQADGVIYAEIRFAPLLHLQQGLGPEQVVEAVDQATDRMIGQTGIEARVILCTLRHFTPEQSMQTVKLVKAFQGTTVVGLDLAGDEAGYPLDAHIEAYQYAREHGLFRTAHAGEGLGPESVWETLRLLSPGRIGHGTRSIEDDELISHLRREQIHLELCPSSNVQIIPSIEDWSKHPIDELYREGLPLSVSTDARMLVKTTLTQEYEGLQRVFGWGAQEYLLTNLMAVDAAFVDEATKRILRKSLIAGYAQASSA